MTNTEKDNNYCFMAVLIVILLFTGGILTYSSIKYVETKNLETTQCQISKINYPKTIESNGWQTCSCGRHCKSQTPCIKLFVNGTKNKFLGKSNKHNKFDCTFEDTKCEVEDFDNKIQAAKQLYNTYINKTVNCFYNRKLDTYFLEKEVSSLGMIIVFSIITGIFTIALFINCYYIIIIGD